MKRFYSLFIAMILVGGIVTGCSSSNEESGSKVDENKDAAVEKDNKKEEKNKKQVYQIGDAAKTKSNANGLPYEIKVNNFKLTTDDVEGYSLEDFDFDAEDGAKFALVNVTVKNIGSKPFVPKETFSGFLTSEMADIPSDDEFFKERTKELAPEDEITGDLVFISGSFDAVDKVYLTFEELSDYEIKFELPIP